MRPATRSRNEPTIGRRAGLEHLLNGPLPPAVTLQVSGRGMAGNGVEVPPSRWYGSGTRRSQPICGWSTRPPRGRRTSSTPSPQPCGRRTWSSTRLTRPGTSPPPTGHWEEPLQGVAVQILLNRCTSEAALRRWLATFAEAIAAVYPSWEILGTIPWPQLTAFIAYTMEGAPEEPQRWNVAPGATARIAALDGGNAFPGAERYISRLQLRRASRPSTPEADPGGKVRSTTPELRQLLRRCLRRRSASSGLSPSLVERRSRPRERTPMWAEPAGHRRSSRAGPRAAKPAISVPLGVSGVAAPKWPTIHLLTRIRGGEGASGNA